MVPCNEVRAHGSRYSLKFLVENFGIRTGVSGLNYFKHYNAPAREMLKNQYVSNIIVQAKILHYH